MAPRLLKIRTPKATIAAIDRSTPSLSPKIGEAARESHVRDQAAEEHARFECPRDVGLERSENGVKGASSATAV